MEEILHHLECFSGTLWTLGNFPCQWGDRQISKPSIVFMSNTVVVSLSSFPTCFQSSSKLFSYSFYTKSTKIKNPHPLLLFYCTFFCSAHLFFPNKKLPPILWTFGLWALRALSLETRCQLWRPFRDFQTTRIHGKKGEISWKWSRKTYNYIDFRRNLCFLLILINSYVINIDVFVL